MTETLHGKLRIAALLLIAGLAVEAITLHWAHPASFLLFLIVGGVLVLAGIAVYLLALISE
jgi:hypothetical protein